MLPLLSILSAVVVVTLPSYKLLVFLSQPKVLNIASHNGYLNLRKKKKKSIPVLFTTTGSEGPSASCFYLRSSYFLGSHTNIFSE